MNIACVYDIAFCFGKKYFFSFVLKSFVINLAILSVYTGRSCEGGATHSPMPTTKIHRTQLTPPIFSSLSKILSYITCPSNNYILFYNHFALLMHISAAVWTSKTSCCCYHATNQH